MLPDLLGRLPHRWRVTPRTFAVVYALFGMLLAATALLNSRLIPPSHDELAGILVSFVALVAGLVALGACIGSLVLLIAIGVAAVRQREWAPQNLRRRWRPHRRA